MDNPTIHSTTILGVYRNGSVAVCGDGQVTLGNTVLKATARKVRRLHHGNVVAGFAGASADAFTLFEAFEGKLEEARGNLFKASVGLAKEWRTDRSLRRLEAMLVVGDTSGLLVISGQGDVLEPDDGLAAIGSGGPYALAAARAFVQSDSGMTVEEIARESLGIAAGICIYTNANISIEAIRQGS